MKPVQVTKVRMKPHQTTFRYIPHLKGKTDMIRYKFLYLCCFFAFTHLVYSQQYDHASSIKYTSGIGFGFANDPIFNYDPPYTDLNFNQLFYTGPCIMTQIGTAVYGPCYYFYGKLYVGIYPTPYYSWGPSYDTVLNLLTQAARDQFVQDVYSFAQVRLMGARIKVWKEDGTVLQNTSSPYWTPDLPNVPEPGIWWADGRYMAARRSANGSDYYVWDQPRLYTWPFWFNAGYPGAEVGLLYADFIMQFYQKQPDGSVAPDAAPPIDFHVKILLRQDWEFMCDSGLIGNCTIGLGHIAGGIPDWQEMPDGINFPGGSFNNI